MPVPPNLPLPNPQSYNSLVEGVPIPPDWGQDGVVASPPISDEELADIRRGRSAIVVLGRVIYHDGLKKPRKPTFCWVFKGFPRPSGGFDDIDWVRSNGPMSYFTTD